jgi:hypothetical protein
LRIVNLANSACVIALLTVVTFAGSSHAFAQEVNFFEKPKTESSKMDFAFKASRFYLASGTMLDMLSTVHALHHPTIASRPDGFMLMRYRFAETEAPGKYFGARNTFGVVASNVALDIGVGFLSDRLYRRGGKWRGVALALNVLQGTNRMRAGFGNVRLNASVDEHVRAVTGYKAGRIIWSH